MESKKQTEGKTGTGRKIVTALIVLALLIGLILAVQYLVGSVDIVELLKKLHAG
jgi:hypothetical protein